MGEHRSARPTRTPIPSPLPASAAVKRFLQVLNGQTPDRPPFWFMRQAGRYLPEYRTVRAEAGSFLDLCFDPVKAAEVTLQPIRRFDMDAAILFSDILVVPHALGQPLAYVEGEGPKLEPVRDGKAVADLSMNSLHGVLGPVYETVERVSRGLPRDVALIGFAGSPWTVACYMVEGGGSKEFGHVKGFAYADPQGFAALIDLLVVSTTDYLARQIVAGAEAVQLFDSWAGVLPEEAFERWCIAPTREIVARLRDLHPSIPIIGFPRGAGALYERYVLETGVDAVGLDTSVPLDQALALQALVPVQGNLDPVLLVAGGPAMRAAAERRRGTLGHAPYIFNLGHGVLQTTSPETVAELAKLLHEPITH